MKTFFRPIYHRPLAATSIESRTSWSRIRRIAEHPHEPIGIIVRSVHALISRSLCQMRDACLLFREPLLASKLRTSTRFRYNINLALYHKDLIRANLLMSLAVTVCRCCTICRTVKSRQLANLEREIFVIDSLLQVETAPKRPVILSSQTKMSIELSRTEQYTKLIVACRKT